MKKRFFNLIFCLGLMVLLSGCLFTPADELYFLPEPPETYKQLQAKLDEVMRELDAEYTAPLTGSNTATVQLHDLNGDGYSESTVAFFRVNSTENPLRIMIFRQRTDGAYQVEYTLSGSGNAIDSVSFVDLDGNGMRDVLVSWQISSKVHTLTAYQLMPTDAIELMHTTYGDSYSVFDLDRDNQQEILVTRLDDSGETPGHVEFYDLESNQMILAATAPLSRGAQSLIPGGTQTGSLRGNIPALFVDVLCGEAAVTDIFTVRNGVFTNVSLNPATGVSGETMRYYTDVLTQDIDSDGIVEIPKPVQTAAHGTSQTSSSFWLINWRQFDANGNAYTVQMNYHNLTDGWSLTIPESWVGQIVLSRDDSRSAQGERAVVFSRWDSAEGAPREFLRISRLSGTNRHLHAQLTNRFILAEDESVIYVAEFTDIGWDSGVSEDNLVKHFTAIHSEWSN